MTAIITIANITIFFFTAIAVILGVLGLGFDSGCSIVLIKLYRASGSWDSGLRAAEDITSSSRQWRTLEVIFGGSSPLC